jgi:hypothetical protein
LAGVIAGLAASPAAARAVDPAGCPALAGDWRGQSVCLDRSIATACADEQVRVRFSADPARPDRLAVHAEKLAGGRFVSMGDSELICAPGGHAWTFDVLSLRTPVRWSYGLEGQVLAGSLAALPSGPVIRRLTAQRESAARPAG